MPFIQHFEFRFVKNKYLVSIRIIDNRLEFAINPNVDANAQCLDIGQWNDGISERTTASELLKKIYCDLKKQENCAPNLIRAFDVNTILSIDEIKKIIDSNVEIIDEDAKTIERAERSKHLQNPN